MRPRAPAASAPRLPRWSPSARCSRCSRPSRASPATIRSCPCRGSSSSICPRLPASLPLGAVRFSSAEQSPMRQFNLPDLGEGLEEAETDKAVVEVPSPQSGRIARLFGGKGDLVKVGAPLVEFAEGVQEDTGTVVGEIDRTAPARAVPAAEPTRARTAQVLPAVRALARKLDVDLNLVQATGAGGMITRADVERAARSMVDAGPAEPLRGMRRAMAQRMATAHAEIARTTVTDEADIDDWRKGEDVTMRLVRAIAAAGKAEPSLNAWYNAEAGERRLIKRIDLGIAVDTEGGLIVPVLRNVSERDARDLRAGLDRMRADAAARSIPPLSNFGMIGGRFANLVVV